MQSFLQSIIYDGVIKKESHITTPESVELQEHLRHAVESGITFAEMEVSSQALKYNRVDNMQFDVGIFSEYFRGPYQSDRASGF